MGDFDGEEYYEMNFVPMKGLAFGVATINRDPPLPWQLLVADSYQKGLSFIFCLSKIIRN